MSDVTRLTFTKSIEDEDECGILSINTDSFRFSCEFPIEYMQDLSNNYLKKEAVATFKKRLMEGKDGCLLFTTSGNLGGPLIKCRENNLIIEIEGAVGFFSTSAELKSLSSFEKEIVISFLDWLSSKI